MNGAYCSVISSLFSHPSSSAILSSVGKVGWVMLLHHFDTVTGVTPSCPASHTPVLSFSTSTSFKRFNFFLSIFKNLNSGANIANIIEKMTNLSDF